MRVLGSTQLQGPSVPLDFSLLATDLPLLPGHLDFPVAPVGAAYSRNNRTSHELLDFSPTGSFKAKCAQSPVQVVHAALFSRG